MKSFKSDASLEWLQKEFYLLDTDQDGFLVKQNLVSLLFKLEKPKELTGQPGVGFAPNLNAKSPAVLYKNLY